MLQPYLMIRRLMECVHSGPFAIHEIQQVYTGGELEDWQVVGSGSYGYVLSSVLAA